MKVNLYKIPLLMSKYGMYVMIVVSSITVGVANELAAQRKKLDEVKISLSNASQFEMEDLLNEIEQNTNFQFAYSKSEIVNQLVVIRGDKEWLLSDLLKTISKQAGVSFKRVNEQIGITIPSEGQSLPPVIDQVDKFIQISGTVTDEFGEALIGATVQIKGTTKGAVTDIDGNFTVEAEEGDILVISYTGFETIEIQVGDQTIINIVLNTDLETLQEVVVVGYGTQKKTDVTGAVARLDESRLENLPNNNVVQALQGSVAGLNINQASASAEGDGFNITIRGANSINANNQPLIVLDGVPYSGSLSDVNPNDIASVDVLKDASSAAIYGSRGANGVILITTKKGKVGETRINYDGFVSTQVISNIPDVLDAEGFRTYKLARFGSLTPTEQENYDAGVSTDWLDVVTRNGFKQQHNLSVSGGAEKTKFYFSGSFLDVEGVTLNDKFTRYSVRVNVQQEITSWLNMATNTQLSLSDRGGRSVSFGSQDGTDPFKMNPLIEPFPNGPDEFVLFPWPEDPFYQNPIAVENIVDEDKTYKVFTNNYMDINFSELTPFLQGVSYRLNTGVEYTQNEADTYFGRDTKNGFVNEGSLSSRHQLEESYLVENILNYNREFGEHRIGFTGLYSYQRERRDLRVINANGFSSDDLSFYQVGQGSSITPRVEFEQTDLISQMARINYAYGYKYNLTFTGRRDGFSAFGDDNKWGFFPSAAAGWTISEENFWPEQKTLDYFKLRVGYGQNGQNALQAYQTVANLRELNFIDNEGGLLPGFIPASLGNESLTWETTTSLNIGIDFDAIDGRIQGSIDYYDKTTDDLLLLRTIPSIYGITEIFQNVGEVSNKGIEIVLNTRNLELDNGLKWTSNINFSFNRNKIERLASGEDDIAKGLFVGEPLGSNFGLIYDGVFQVQGQIQDSAQPDAEVGHAIVKDIDGDGDIDADDRTIIGDIQPDFVWGFTNVLTYKQFSLSMFWQGVQGVERPNDIYDDVDENARNNIFEYEAWSAENPTNFRWSYEVGSNPNRVQIVEDASFARLKDLTLTYTMPASILEKAQLRNLTIYATGRNLVTITNWNGLDPELSAGGSRAIPLQTEYVLGVKVGL